MSRRKLKPIYDLLDVGNNRKVIQEVDKLLIKPSTISNKQSHDQDDDDELVQMIAKSLKSLALVRTGKAQDAEVVINDLLDKNIADENVLSLMMQYCKETQQLSKIVLFYENALKKDPQNEEILNSLFYAYVRNYDFPKQQQTSLKLYRQTGIMIYCYWQAVSYVMLTKNQTNPAQSNLQLQLAEKILEKAYNDKKMEMNGEFQFYVDLLETNSKFEVALDLVDRITSDEEFKIGEYNYKIKKQINLLKLMCDKTPVNSETRLKLKEKCEVYLTDNTDDWLIIKVYLNCIIDLFKCDNKNIDVLQKFELFFQNLFQKCKYNKGPLLAILDLHQSLTNESINHSSLSDVLNMLTSNFGRKPGFYYDLIYFKDLMKNLHLNSKILTMLEYDKTSVDTVDDIYKLITYWQFYYYSNNNQLSADQVGQIKRFYIDGLKLGN